LIHGEEFNGQLFEEPERIHGPGGADAALDDIVKLAPVDPAKDGAAARLVLVVESLLNDLLAGFAVK
jgi:hypothetical protein